MQGMDDIQGTDNMLDLDVTVVTGDGVLGPSHGRPKAMGTFNGSEEVECR